MSNKGKAFINIENVVASATLKQQIDLNAIVRVFPGVEYRPEQFPGLVYRLKKPKTATLTSARERWCALVPSQSGRLGKRF